MSQTQHSYEGKSIGQFFGDLLDGENFRQHVFTIVTQICGDKRIEFSSRKMTRLERSGSGFALTFAPVQWSVTDWGEWDFVWSEDGSLPGRPILKITVQGEESLHQTPQAKAMGKLGSLERSLRGFSDI